MTSPLPAIRRIVTGHDAHGKAIVTEQGKLPTVVELSAIPGTVFHEVWSTSGAPCLVSNGEDPTRGPLTLPPPSSGTRIRFVDIPPDTAEFLAQGAGLAGERGVGEDTQHGARGTGLQRTSGTELARADHRDVQIRVQHPQSRRH